MTQSRVKCFPEFMVVSWKDMSDFNANTKASFSYLKIGLGFGVRLELGAAGGQGRGLPHHNAIWFGGEGIARKRRKEGKEKQVNVWVGAGRGGTETCAGEKEGEGSMKCRGGGQGVKR